MEMEQHRIDFCKDSKNSVLQNQNILLSTCKDSKLQKIVIS